MVSGSADRPLVPPPLRINLSKNMPPHEVISIHEIRRRAPMHYWAKADNARFAAYSLWKMMQCEMREHAEAVGYNGNPSIALNESFLREASIALELIIKAVIAQRVERGTAEAHVTKVRTTHDLASLWKDALLPPLPSEDQHRLLIAKRILYWAGRYAAPKEDQDYDKEQAAMNPLEDRKEFGGRLKIIKSRSFDWDYVDRIYQIAMASFLHIRQNA
jgi:hypothetical protein